MVDIVGTIGNDTLTGQITDDKLEGKEGNDILIGGGGNDQLYGGEDNDTYKFYANQNNGTDVIEDDKGINKIQILNANATTGVESAYQAARTTITVTTSAVSPESVFVLIEYMNAAGTAVIATSNIEVKKVLKDGVIDPNATTRQIVDGAGNVLVDFGAMFGGGGGGGGGSGSGTPTSGSDYLIGTELNDTINALGGADTIEALGGNDVLIGGAGDDLLIGGAGADEYRFAGNFGNDTIQEGERIAGEPFGGVITLTSTLITEANHLDAISVERGGVDPYSLVVTVRNPTTNAVMGTITIEGFFISADPLVTDPSGRVYDVVLADGFAVSLVELIDTSLATGILYGTNLADSLTGTEFTDDIMFGLQGNDIMKGLLGYDNYVFAVGDGQDTVEDVTPELPVPPGELPFDPSQGGVITLVNVTPSQVKLMRTDAGLIVTYGALGADTIKIVGAYDEPVNGLGTYTGTISEIRFVTATDPRDPETFVDQLDGLGEPLVIDLTGPVTFTGSSGADILLGTDGDDTINAGSGNDFIQAGTGVNTINGGSGIDTVTLGNEFGPAVGEIVDLTGALTVGQSRYTSVENVEGTRGNDTIFASSAVNLISGDAGIDTVSYEKSTSTSGVTVSLQAANEVNLGGWAAGDILELIENLTGTSKNDNLTGSGGANTLNGGGGVDTLNGLGGDDRLIGGAGNDIYNGGAGSDTAVLTANLNASTQNYVVVGSYVHMIRASDGVVLERIGLDVETVEFSNGNLHSLSSLIGL